MPDTHRLAIATLLYAITSMGVFSSYGEEQDEAKASEKEVSYIRDIEPIFRSNCQGCHQPAKPQGEYEMTSFKALISGGESGDAAIVPGKPDDSYLIQQIIPEDGVAEMPRGGKPLHEAEIDLIRQWIAQGAKNDSPPQTGPIYNSENPPVYSRPPVITSLDFAPDGKLLAIAGFHEVLLVETEKWQRVDRLVGLSERIESVRFSPDGTKLAVAAGLPSRMGEIQIWNVSERELTLSKPVTFDTVYGVSWSPDGKMVAFGGADSIVRAIDAESGEQKLFQSAHDDWVRSTAFNNDGSHLVSVGRDMTCKLTEVATERFIDNITSITPGALQGGVNSVVMHPQRDEIFVGGADGIPKVYRIFRQTARKIGDDANLLKKLPAMKGRIFSVDISQEGSLLAAVSTLNGSSEVRVFNYVPEEKFPGDIKAIQGKRVQQRSAEEKKKLEAYVSSSIEQKAHVEIPETASYSLAFDNGQRLAVAGSDGMIRIINCENGEISASFAPAPTATPEQIATTDSQGRSWAKERTKQNPAGKQEKLPAGRKIATIVASPQEIELNGALSYVQLMLTGELDNGDAVDVTRIANISVRAPLCSISSTGLLRPLAEGETELEIELEDQRLTIPVVIKNIEAEDKVDFVQDVNPVLSRLGCNSGTCHGAKDGKNGFKMSLRGYDPIYDVRALTDDLASRRVNIASPDDSLMLLKPLGMAPHEGGVLLNAGEPYHAILRSWIASGASLDLESPKVASIEILPQNPVAQAIGSRQQIRVIATYTDQSQKDVTREAFAESGNTDVATCDSEGLMTSVRRGEAAILARYEGSYAATTLTVMGDREGFAWATPETWGPIDEFVSAKWDRLKIAPSGLCDDAEFVRRVYLDLTGLPPTAADVRLFLDDPKPTREKRQELIDRLIGNEAFVEFWTNKWADLLQVNRKFLGAEGAKLFRDWIRERVSSNMPYNQFVKEIITANGSNKENPAASYYKILRVPEDTMENTTHLFLGVRFNCNKCHDHPFERWTQDQYYETSAYFARMGLKKDPNAGDKKIGGTAVEGAKPLYEVVFEKDAGEQKHERTGEVTAPEFPYSCDYEAPENANRREQLAAWITSADNQYFAKSYVNRIWGYLTGTGIIEPIDDIRAGNPPTNPELLEYLTQQFIESGFDTRHLMRLICESRTYQLSVESNEWNVDDQQNYSHAKARRLPAEVLYDAVHLVTGAQSKIPGVPAGTRAAAIPDAGIKLADGFLANFGRPARESACECERSSELQLGPVMALVSGPTVGSAISDPGNDIRAIAEQQEDIQKLVDEVFIRVLNRPARPHEVDAFQQIMEQISVDHEDLKTELAQREQWWKEERERREARRLEQLASIEKEKAERLAAIKPERDKMEADRQAKIAKAEGELKAYRDKLIDHALAWEKKQKTSEWFLLQPKEMTASNGATLTRQADRSIIASAKKEKGHYVITVETGLQKITGFRLEALPLDIPGGGPGLPANGNFVVTEFTVHAAPKDKPESKTKLKLQDPRANFTQAAFNIAQAIDGNGRDQRGWAVSPAGGTVHWATFATEKPIEHAAGTVLTFTIDQYHNAPEHRLGHFRLSATSDSGKIELGLPESLLATSQIPQDKRSDEQKKLLTDYFAKVDAGLTSRNTAVAEAKKPLPADVEVVRLDKRIKFLQQSTQDDPGLLQLRADLEQSKLQVAKSRLTATEDLTWALINSPAFLFNH